MTWMTPPSGHQYRISFDDQQAIVVEVGGGIRGYTVGGEPVLDGYPEDQMCSGARGAPLIPWPNRLADGRYRFDGVDHQLPLTEPETHNAIHGLTRWQRWAPLDHSAERVVMGHLLTPQPGYPFMLRTEITYQLHRGGLTVTTTATNVGDRRCPYAHGQHPYLTAGTDLIDDCTLTVGGNRVLLVDERGLPTSSEEVAGTRYDFREPRRIGDVAIDNAYTDLDRDPGGLAWATLSAPDGRTVRAWVDRTYRYLEVFTGDSQPESVRRRGLGIEPMTCPPNGFARGDHLIVLEPGESITTEWGIQPRLP